MLDCAMLKIEPNKRLAYTLDFAHWDAASDLRSAVMFTLTPMASGMKIEQAGFRSI